MKAKGYKAILYHGVPAVINGDQWIIISSNFDNFATIPKDEIDSDKYFQELTKAGFFKNAPPEHTTESDVTQVTLITTSDCNLRCRYCFANSGEKTLIMDERIAKASVRHAITNAKGRRLSVAFFGGEPTMTQQLIKDVVRYAVEESEKKGVKAVEFSITTNGVMSPAFLQFLIDQNFQITLSVDGPDYIQNTHRPLKTGQGSYTIVERSIKELVRQKANFKIRTTVTDYSVDSMDKTVEWAHNLGIKQIQFEPISISGRASLATKGGGLGKPSVTSFITNLKKAIKKGSKLDVGVINSAIMNIQNSPARFCDGNSTNRFAVTFNGDVTTCVEVQEKCHPVFSQFTIGKYNPDSDTLEFDKQSRSHACLPGVKIKPYPECATCFAKRVCGGGCPVRNYHVTGDSAVVDPYRCKTIKEMLPYIYKLIYNYNN